MASTIVQDLFDSMSRLVMEDLAANVAGIADEIFPVMAAAIGIYIVMVIYQVIYTENANYIKEAMKNILALVVVGVFTFSASYYMDYVVPFVMNAGDDLSKALVGGAPAPEALDHLIDVLADGVQKTFDALGFNPFTDDMKIAAQGMTAIFIALVGGIPFIISCVAYLIVAKFMVGLLLTVGLIFFCFSFFPATRNMFQSWTGQCLNYILMAVLFTLVETILIKFIESHMAPDGEFNIEWVGVIQLAVVFFVSNFLLAQVSILSSSLTGGVGINGLNGSVAGAARATAGLAKSAGSLLGRGAGAAGGGLKSAGMAAWNAISGKGGVKAG